MKSILKYVTLVIFLMLSLPLLAQGTDNAVEIGLLIIYIIGIIGFLYLSWLLYGFCKKITGGNKKIALIFLLGQTNFYRQDKLSNFHNFLRGAIPASRLRIFLGSASFGRCHLQSIIPR